MEEAVALGLATRVDADPRQAALELARSVAGRSPQAIRAAKRLLDLAGRVDLATGFAAEQQEIGALIGSPNQVEAVAAEFGKRPPGSPTRPDEPARAGNIWASDPGQVDPQVVRIPSGRDLGRPRRPVRRCLARVQPARPDAQLLLGAVVRRVP